MEIRQNYINKNKEIKSKKEYIDLFLKDNKNGDN